MHNYNLSQRLLHKIALAPKLMREASFDIERGLFHNNLEAADGNHVFVSGLARSGTTLLLNTLFNTEDFASLTYDDMPFLLAPNLWSKLTGFKQHEFSVERAHGDGMLVGTDSVEAFEEVFWNTFPDNEIDSHEKFKDYVRLILGKYKKLRYLSKNNQNIKRIRLINKIFPKSPILVPFRDPLQQSYSLLGQHKRFVEFGTRDKFITSYMALIGHTEFGDSYKPIADSQLKYENYMTLNHWLEQWLTVYKNILNVFDNIDMVKLVCYETFCEDSEVLNKIGNIVDKKLPKLAEFKQSVRDIDDEYDDKLLEACNHIYSELKVRSI